MLFRGRWLDTCKICATAQGAPEPDATCFVRATSNGSRIDAILANNIAGHMVGEAGVIADTLLPTHAPVALEMRIGDCSREVTVSRQPKRIPLAFADPDRDAESCIADRVCRDVVAETSACWSAAVARKNVEALWKLWCFDAESYLCRRACLAGLNVDQADLYYEIQDVMQELSYAGNMIAQQYLDGEIDKTTAIELQMKYSLTSREKSTQRIGFVEAHRAYVINYNLGQDIVKQYVEKLVGDGDEEKKWQVFMELLSNPRTASMMQ